MLLVNALNNNMYKCVFIDLDDTLWDFHANAKESLHEVYIVRHLSDYFKDFEEFFKIYAKRNLELWEMYGKGLISQEFLKTERFRYPLAKMGHDNFELAEQIGVQFLEFLPTKTTLVPYAKELLDYLKPKYPLTIISNGFVEVQYKKLRATNLEDYFEHIVLSESAKALKPDKKIFEYALELNRINASEAIMIGDSFDADIQGAKNAGIDQIYYYPASDKKEYSFSPTYTINKLEEIIKIL
jgi:putative hydrolase of the HAD superfamily